MEARCCRLGCRRRAASADAAAQPFLAYSRRCTAGAQLKRLPASTTTFRNRSSRGHHRRGAAKDFSPKRRRLALSGRSLTADKHEIYPRWRSARRAVATVASTLAMRPASSGSPVAIVSRCAAAHVIDGHGNRLHRHCRVADRARQRGESGEFEQAGDGAAVEVARPPDDVLVERHHQAAFVPAVLDPEAEQLGVGGERFHKHGFSGCAGYAKCEAWDASSRACVSPCSCTRTKRRE